jgi:hypothetical protein
VNNKKYSDVSILTNESEKFYMHKGLLAHGLRNDEAMNGFLSKIDGKVSKIELDDIVRKLYRGFGVMK